MTQPTTKRLLNLADAAHYLSLSESKLWKMSKSREIPSVRIGRALRFDVRQLDQWIDEQMANSVEDQKPA